MLDIDGRVILSLYSLNVTMNPIKLNLSKGFLKFLLPKVLPVIQKKALEIINTKVAEKINETLIETFRTKIDLRDI